MNGDTICCKRDSGGGRGTAEDTPHTSPIGKRAVSGNEVDTVTDIDESSSVVIVAAADAGVSKAGELVRDRERVGVPD